MPDDSGTEISVCVSGVYVNQTLYASLSLEDVFTHDQFDAINWSNKKEIKSGARQCSMFVTADGSNPFRPDSPARQSWTYTPPPPPGFVLVGYRAATESDARLPKDGKYDDNYNIRPGPSARCTRLPLVKIHLQVCRRLEEMVTRYTVSID